MFKKILIFLIAIGLSGGPQFAVADLPRKAPDFPKKGIWFNAPNNSQIDDLKGVVTFIHFWDYSSINFIRNFSYLKQWQDLYGPLGFQVIGVHSPDYEFAYKKKNVKSAINRLGITYPVLMDNNFKAWNRFEVFSWPTQFIIDQNGKIVYEQRGEGNYREVEEMIRHHLSLADPTTRFPPLISSRSKGNLFDMTYCGAMSEEVRVGTKSGSALGGPYLANEQGLKQGSVIEYVDRGTRQPRGFFAHGPWKNHSDHFEHSKKTDSLEHYLGVNFQGNEAYGVLSSSQWGPVRFYLLLDSEPMLFAQMGKDVQIDADGNTFVQVGRPRLYYLLKDIPSGVHELKLYTKDEGASVHAFSFGNRCLTQFEKI